MNYRIAAFLIYLFIGVTPAWAMDAENIHMHIISLKDAPVLDGDAGEWITDSDLWTEVLTTEASFVDDVSEKTDSTHWDPQPLMAAGIYQDTLYLAIRWRDESPDKVYRPWKLRGSKYSRSRRKDDMLALRFNTGGDFDACMLAGKDYRVDLWRWSAGRSQKAAMADDMSHIFSTTPVEHGIEYRTETKPVYYNGRPPSSAGEAFTV